MDASGRQRWLRTVILLGAVYLVIGIAFGTFAGWWASNQMVVTWRLLSFFTSAVVFAVHIGHEHFRLGNSPLLTASHASMAVAVGAFGIAVAANVHGLVTSNHQRSLIFALVAFPALTAIPAFVVALVAAAGLALSKRST